MGVCPGRRSSSCAQRYPTEILSPETLKDPLTFFLPDHGCLLEGGNVTVTRGLEWTPRGYRKFIKVDGVHDDWMMIPKDSIEVEVPAGLDLRERRVQV